MAGLVPWPTHWATQSDNTIVRSLAGSKWVIAHISVCVLNCPGLPLRECTHWPYCLLSLSVCSDSKQVYSGWARESQETSIKTCCRPCSVSVGLFGTNCETLQCGDDSVTNDVSLCKIPVWLKYSEWVTPWAESNLWFMALVQKRRSNCANLIHQEGRRIETIIWEQLRTFCASQWLCALCVCNNNNYHTRLYLVAPKAALLVRFAMKLETNPTC